MIDPQQAATTIQLAYRSYKARSEMIPKIGPHLIGSNSNLLGIAKKVSSLIQKKSSWGKYQFFKKHSCYYRVSPDGKSVDLQFKVLSNSKERRGTHRKVLPAQSFNFDLVSKKLDCSTSVLATFHDIIPAPRVKTGLIHLDKLNQMPKPPNVYLVDTPCKLTPRTYSQSWFQNDLHHAFYGKEGLNVDVDPSKGVEKISKEQCFPLLEQVVTSAGWIHDQGYVHKDLKEANICLRKNGDELCAYIADFDLVGRFGYDFSSKDAYHIWDPCYQFYAISTPFCDWFSIAVILFQLLDPTRSVMKFVEAFRNCFYDDLIKNEGKEPSYYYGDDYKELKPCEKEAYQLLYDTCKISVDILKELVKIKYFPHRIKARDVCDAIVKVGGVGYREKMIQTIKDVAKNAS